MSNAAVRALRALIVVLLLGLLLGQVVLVPVLSGEMAREYPAVGWVRWPLAAVVIAVLACVQVGLVAIWRLLRLVGEDEVFTAASFRHVDVIIGAVVVATALTAAVCAFLNLWGNGNPPGVFLGLVGLTLGGATLALLMGVMRALLREATRQRSDLAEVV